MGMGPESQLTTEQIQSFRAEGRIPFIVPVRVYNHTSTEPGCTQGSHRLEEKFLIVIPQKSQIKQTADYYLVTTEEVKVLTEK